MAGTNNSTKVKMINGVYSGKKLGADSILQDKTQYGSASE